MNYGRLNGGRLRGSLHSMEPRCPKAVEVFKQRVELIYVLQYHRLQEHMKEFLKVQYKCRLPTITRTRWEILKRPIIKYTSVYGMDAPPIQSKSIHQVKESDISIPKPNKCFV